MNVKWLIVITIKGALLQVQSWKNHSPHTHRASTSKKATPKENKSSTNSLTKSNCLINKFVFVCVCVLMHCWMLLLLSCDALCNASYRCGDQTHSQRTRHGSFRWNSYANIQIFAPFLPHQPRNPLIEYVFLTSLSSFI